MNIEFSKTCPNCGTIDGQGKHCTLENWMESGWQVACWDCGIHDLTRPQPTPERAVADWERIKRQAVKNNLSPLFTNAEPTIEEIGF